MAGAWKQFVGRSRLLQTRGVCGLQDVPMRLDTQGPRVWKLSDASVPPNAIDGLTHTPTGLSSLNLERARKFTYVPVASGYR